MMRLSLIMLALAGFGCGEKPTTPKAAPATNAAATTNAAGETEAALSVRYAAEVKAEITPENADKAAEALLKEIAADAP